MTDTIELQGPYTVPPNGAPVVGPLDYASPLNDGKNELFLLLPELTMLPPPRRLPFRWRVICYMQSETGTLTDANQRLTSLPCHLLLLLALTVLRLIAQFRSRRTALDSATIPGIHLD